MLYNTPIEAAKANIPSSNNTFRFRSQDLNNVTAIKKNILYYKKGQVIFSENTPFNVRKRFIINGTGNKLKKYITNVLFDEDKNIVTITAEKIIGIKEIIKKIIGQKTRTIEQVFHLSGNSHLSKHEFAKFISKLK